MIKDLHEFFKKLDEDPELKKELKKALEVYPEEDILYNYSFDEQIRFIYEVIIPFAKERGFEFNLEDIAVEGGLSIDDEDLAKVAGGVGLGTRLSVSALAALQALTLMSPINATTKTADEALAYQLSSSSSQFENETEQAKYDSVVNVLEKAYKTLHPISKQYLFNEVDGMIFATLVYLPMYCVPNLNSDMEDKEITIAQWAERMSKYYETSDKKLILHSEDEHSINKYDPKRLNANSDHTVMQRGRVKLLSILAKCPRYKDIKLGNFRGKYSPYGNVDSEQFAAVTFTLGDGTKIVSFRGTDGTTSGWKEDLDLSWSKQVPAQKDALSYLEKIYSLNPNSDFFVTGHSKGGHLALYSSFYMCAKDGDFSGKLKGILNYDGPGFRKDIVSDINPELFDKTSKKLTNFIPQSSIFGRIMNDTSKGKFVCMYSSSEDIFYQHDSLTWNICEDYDEAEAKFRAYEIQPESEFSADAISRFMDNIDKENGMRICVNWIFDFMHRNNISMEDTRDSSEIFKEVFYNYFIKGKTLSEIIDAVFSPGKTIELSKEDQEGFKQVMWSACKALAVSYWGRREDINKKLLPDRSPKNIVDIIFNKVLTLENVGNFIKKLYS